ncbi:MAG TPA: 6-phosphogluconolactonase [Pyrinomonadaceae bacterium]|nr:6-phosphogluconolactonase [Pyrinomonadaceae bacterium]
MSATEAVEIRVFDDAEQVARATAARFVELADLSLRERGNFSVALSGGSTPRRVYELLAADFGERVRWPSVEIFFGDERCVPPEHRDSNYRMADEALLSRVPLSPASVHRMACEDDADEGARRYEQQLRAYFKDQEWPRFDLVMLGMGEDGHTASLFPYTRALGEQQAWVVANRVEHLEALRLTLTVPAINHARHVLFNVVGAGKAERLREVLQGARDPERLPAQLIRPTTGRLAWFLDRAAAEKL